MRRCVLCIFVFVAIILLWFDATAATMSSSACPATTAASSTADMTTHETILNACIRSGESERALAWALASKHRAQATPAIADDQIAFSLVGKSYVYLSNYTEAILAYKTAQAFGSQGSVKALAIIENNLADIYIRSGQFEDAIALAKQAVTLYEQAQNRETGGGYTTLAQAYLANGEITLARQTLAIVLTDYAQNSTPLATAYAFQVDAKISFAEGKFRDAIAKANRAINFAEERHLVMEMAKSYLTRAQAESLLLLHDQSLASAQRAIQIAQQQKDLESEFMAWQHLEQWQRENRAWQAAYTAQENVLRLSRQLFDQQLANTVAVQRVLRDVAQKEQALATSQRETQIAQAEKRTAEAQRTITILISILLFSIGSLIYFLILYRRDRRRSEQTQVEQKKLDTLKNQFLANTSHELRTPLNGIIGITDNLLSDTSGALPTEIKSDLEWVRHCGVQLSGMVDAILDFSQITAGKPLCHIESIDISPIISRACRLVAPLAQKKSLPLHCHIAAPLPNVAADGERIQQVLINLLDNAIKFTEHGQITLTAQLQDQRVCVHITDTGMGIDASLFRVIFTPFEQVDGTLQRRHTGVGLGLPISREIVRAHGGELAVESTPGRGSTFHFSLPLAGS